MTRKKPVGKEETLKDLESHPERGKIDGEEVVRFKTVNIQASIPAEMHSQLLEVGGAFGIENKNELLRLAIASFLTQPGTVAMVERWQSRKAEKHNVNKFEIKSKTLGSYKRVARVRAARLEQ
jgi:hypothetical protein